MSRKVKIIDWVEGGDPWGDSTYMTPGLHIQAADADNPSEFLSHPIKIPFNNYGAAMFYAAGLRFKAGHFPKAFPDQYETSVVEEGYYGHTAPGHRISVTREVDGESKSIFLPRVISRHPRIRNMATRGVARAVAARPIRPAVEAQ